MPTVVLAPIPANSGFLLKEKSKIHLPVLGLSTPGQLQWEPGRKVKMGALEELDDPGALQPEREVTEHPTQ